MRSSNEQSITTRMQQEDVSIVFCFNFFLEGPRSSPLCNASRFLNFLFSFSSRLQHSWYYLRGQYKHGTGKKVQCQMLQVSFSQSLCAIPCQFHHRCACHKSFFILTSTLHHKSHCILHVKVLNNCNSHLSI